MIFFVWPYQNKNIKLLALVLFINKTDRQPARQTDRQTDRRMDGQTDR